MRNAVTRFVATLLYAAIAFLSGCGRANAQAARQENQDLEVTAQRLLAKTGSREASSPLPTIEVDGMRYHVAEGDLLLDDDEYLLYRLRHSTNDRVVLEQATLIAVADYQGRTIRWAPDTPLTYAVLKRTFTTSEAYAAVAANLDRATREWESICNVTFRHITAADDANTLVPPGVTFAVREIDAHGAFFAESFFPNDPPDRRHVWVDPSYFHASYDPVGIFRHEIGHILGFRHEHIRSGAPAACPNESGEHVVAVTRYDPRSVMHYFCGNVGTRTLAFTEVDRTGAALIYGSPTHKAEGLFVDVR